MNNDLQKLRDIFGPITQIEASYKVHAKATYYPHFIRVYIPNIPYDKVLPFMEPTTSPVKNGLKSKHKSALEDLENLLRSLRRTKKVIRDYVLCNEFELFATFTFKEDRQDTDKCKSKMSNWLKNQNKRIGKFDYLIVPEFHKDKESLHFHALIRNYAGKLVEATNPNTGELLKQKDRQIYTFPSYTLGFNNVIKIVNTPESHEKVGSYVRKYITKDMPQFHGKNRFWASRGLSVPRVVENPQPWYKYRVPLRVHVSEYGSTFTFPLQADSLDDLSRGELRGSSV